MGAASPLPAPVRPVKAVEPVHAVRPVKAAQDRDHDGCWVIMSGRPDLGRDALVEIGEVCGPLPQHGLHRIGPARPGCPVLRVVTGRGACSAAGG
jgi:hypothetical protein